MAALAALVILALGGVPLLRYLRPAAGALPPAPARQLFVWDAGIVSDPATTADLLAFAASRGIDVLAVEASPLGYGLPGSTADYSAFVDAAHASGMMVLALGGNPWFAVSCDAGVPGQLTCYQEGWDLYSTIVASGVPFDGVIDDSEAYLASTGHWWANVESRAQQYLDWLEGLRLRVEPLPLYATIPFWYDEDARLELQLYGAPEAHPLTWYVAQIADVMCVMDYRDAARGADGIIAHGAGEVATGPCILAVETEDLGPAQDKLTFWEEGERAMERQLRVVAKHFDGSPDFVGIAIHHYGSYRALRR